MSIMTTDLNRYDAPHSAAGSRVEITYDFRDANKVLKNVHCFNKPLTARLKYIKGAHGRTLSQPISPLDDCLPRYQSPFRNLASAPMSDESDRDDIPWEGEDVDSLLNFTGEADPSPFHQLYNTPTSAFNRSVSMPTLRSRDCLVKESIVPTSRKPSINTMKSSHESSRRSSFFCDCKHQANRKNSVSCKNSIVALNDPAFVSGDMGSEDCDESFGSDLCKRHHHRRGSVAIKFDEPEVVPKRDLSGDSLRESLEQFELEQN